MGNHGLSNVYLVKTDEKSGLSLNSVDNFAAVRVLAQIKRRSCFVLIYAGCVQTLEESEGGARRPVSRVLSLPRGQGMAIHLGRPLPGRLTRPTRMAARKPARTRRFCHPYLVLLPVGFALPPPLPAARCALTAPFHPCRPIAAQAARGLAVCFCGTFPGVAPAGRYPAPCFHGARTFLPRLMAKAAIRPSGAAIETWVSAQVKCQTGEEGQIIPPAQMAIRRLVSISSTPSQRSGRKWR